MAAGELDFEGDEMQVDEGSMLRVHSLVNAQLFEDVAEEEGNTTSGPKAKSCKQDASSLLGQLTDPQECGQKRRRFKCIKRSLSGWSRVHFSHESSRDLLRAKKPEDDSYKGRVQRDLEDRMMRMMRTRRTTFSGNNMSADLDENFNLNLRWRLRFQARIVRWNRCCRWDEKLSSWWVGVVYKSTAWVFMEAAFEAPTASTESLKTSNIHNPGLHFLKKAFFKLIVIYSLDSQHLKKLSTTTKRLMHVKIIDWRYRTMRRTKNDLERKRKT